MRSSCTRNALWGVLAITLGALIVLLGVSFRTSSKLRLVESPNSRPRENRASRHLQPHEGKGQEIEVASHPPALPGQQLPLELAEMEQVQLNRSVLHVSVTDALTKEPFVVCVHVGPHEIKPGLETYIWQPILFDKEVWITGQTLKGWGEHIHHVLAFVKDETPQHEGASAVPFIFGEGSSVRVPLGNKLYFELHYLNQTLNQTEISALAFNLTTTPMPYETFVATTSPDDYQEVLVSYRHKGKPRYINVTASLDLNQSKAECIDNKRYGAAWPYAINTHTHGYGLAVHFEARFATAAPLTFTIKKERISKGGSAGGFFYALPKDVKEVWNELVGVSVSCLYDVLATPVAGAMGMDLGTEMCEVWLYTNTPSDAFNSRVHMLTDPGLGVEKLAEYRKPDACVTASVKLQSLNAAAVASFGAKDKATDVIFAEERRVDPTIRFNDKNVKCAIVSPVNTPATVQSSRS